jgi:hypothetical protein
MGYGLEDILDDLKNFSEQCEYFLTCIGYKPTDISNLIGDLELKLREAHEETHTPKEPL